MSRITKGSAVLLVLTLAASCAERAPTATSDREARSANDRTASLDQGGGRIRGGHVSMLDACDPDDPAWTPTGGCMLIQGDVSFAEFNEMAGTPLSVPPMGVLVGHPAWRNEPSYLSIGERRPVIVTNDGGRVHTFTRVAQFGGGRVPPLNRSLVPAPECLTPGGEVPAGGRTLVEALDPGVHRFQCCFHPWMRAVIRVGPPGTS
jgi:hypothetical protein